MASEKDTRQGGAALGAWPGPLLGQPCLDFTARKEQLSGGLRARNFAGSRKVIDLALLDPKELGQLLGREKLRHGRAVPFSRH